MTKKDYIILANAIKEAQTWAGTDQKSGVKLTAQYIMDSLYHDNNKFSYDKFEKACGYNNNNPIV